MSKSRANKKQLISKVKNGKISSLDFKRSIRYEFDKVERKYILNKLSNKYFDLAYNNPMPKFEEDISAEDSFFYSDSPLVNELKWYFDLFDIYYKELNIFHSEQIKIEQFILKNNLVKVIEIIDSLEKKISCSLYFLLLEIFINERQSESKKNEELIREISSKIKVNKIPIILEFARLRLKMDLPSWQYDSTLEHHRQMYSNESKNLMDYLTFKFDPLNFQDAFEFKEFILNFESDFSLIDRYNSLKEFLPHLIDSLELDSKRMLYSLVEPFRLKSSDPYWAKLSFLLEKKEIYPNMNSEFQKLHDEIAECYFDGNYSKVLIFGEKYLKEYPDITEIYCYYLKSLILCNEEISKELKQYTHVYNILLDMRAVLDKGSEYIVQRDKVVDNFYRSSFFNFSVSTLQDIYSEFSLVTPLRIYNKAFLTSKVLSYTSMFCFEIRDFINLSASIESKWLNYLVNVLTEENGILPDLKKFFQVELYVEGSLYSGRAIKALKVINDFQKQKDYIKFSPFIKTWITKKKIISYLKLERIGESVKIMVHDFFDSNIFYDHYFSQEILDYLLRNDESDFYSELSIPIFFQITKQSQANCYDSIANFLIKNDLFKPSEIRTKLSSFNKYHLIFFLEKCCVKSHIEDSPYLNTMDALSQERISILNCLKDINPDKSSIYNEEILNITKEDSIRKGVKHIHESRIFVDTESLNKIVSPEIKEVFDRYLSIDEKNYSALSSLTLDEIFDPNRVESMFYCLEPVSEGLLELYLIGEPIMNDNIVRVPLIRYHHFVLLFDEIKKQFVFNEDYGFKSFLSMRIRHGTFSNVLRNVFDKFNLISAKESTSDEYKIIEYWNSELNVSSKDMTDFQSLLKQKSQQIDELIDVGLGWIKILEFEDDKSSLFNFNFTDKDNKALFINRIGKLDNHKEFINETFQVLYETLEDQLIKVRRKISQQLLPKFIEIIEDLEIKVFKLFGKEKPNSIVQEQIIACKTEIQVVINQIEEWFKISQNHYVEEFPMEMILDTSLDYINSINGDILSTARVTKKVSCKSKYKGRYFEGFGDMFINIFDNIIKNNKDLSDKLEINVNVETNGKSTKIRIDNNISPLIKIEELDEKIHEIKAKVNNYKKGNLKNSFEEGSGYLKICRCVSADLEQKNYEVDAFFKNNKYIIEIEIENTNLII